MRSLLRLIERRLARETSGVGLGVFRIVWGSVLLLEVAQLAYFRRFFFDPVPDLVPHVPDLTLAFGLWMVAIGCLIVGWRTRLAAFSRRRPSRR